MNELEKLDRIEQKINFLTNFVIDCMVEEGDDRLSPEDEELVRKAKEDWDKGVNMYTQEDVENARKEAGLEI